MSLEISEILSPPRFERRRPAASGSDEVRGREPKKSRFETVNGTPPVSSGPVDTEAILKALEDNEPEPLDELGVKKLILQFEKRVLANQELRIKYADSPERFMESEVELHVAIQEMHAIATMPNLYNLLGDLNAVDTLVQLLMHDNTDVSIAVVNLLMELTDVDTLTESDEGATALVEALGNGQVIGLMVQNIERLDESNKEEADAVHNSLAVVENMMEFQPELSGTTVSSGLLVWLLKRIRARLPFDGNKLYSSEILAILLQNSEEVKKSLGEMEGIDILLSQLAQYKRHDPSSRSENEYMENLFNCLCASLLFAANRIKFLKGEGLQLMNLMLRERKQSRASALRVLNYATTGREGKENCDKLVEILGLRTIFPLFMKTPAKDKRKGYSIQDHEEHVCSILASLLRYCSSSQRDRILSKFAEQDCAKVERLMELHFKYLEKVNLFEKKFMDQNRSSEEMDDEQLYLQKLEAGLFTLQVIDYILAQLMIGGSGHVRDRISKILSLRGGTIKSIKNILREYAGSLGDDTASAAGNEEGGSSSKESGKEGGKEGRSDREKLLDLVDKL